VRAHVLRPDRCQPVCRRGEANGGFHVRRAGFEPVRHDIPRRLLIAHELDHVTAHLPWSHDVEQCPPPPQSAAPHWCAHLVSAERVEIDTERLHVNGEMRHGLCAVAYNNRARGMGHLSDLCNRTDRSQHIGNVWQHDRLYASVEQCPQMIEVDLA
jgi:hypothetical protein